MNDPDGARVSKRNLATWWQGTVSGCLDHALARPLVDCISIPRLEAVGVSTEDQPVQKQSSIIMSPDLVVQIERQMLQSQLLHLLGRWFKLHLPCRQALLDLLKQWITWLENYSLLKNQGVQ